MADELPDEQIHVTDVEAAINYWRAQPEAVDGVVLGPQLRALAAVYAQMAYRRQASVTVAAMPPLAWHAWMQWYETMPDTPCIAICSTSQGDDVCKGCGRTFAEVRHWTAMTPPQKRAVWRRITQEATAWRFNRYKERVPAKFLFPGND